MGSGLLLAAALAALTAGVVARFLPAHGAASTTVVAGTAVEPRPGERRAA
jgi:hypothetical protein